MSTAELARIERFLPTQIGKNATFYRYSRAAKNPMNFVLDEATRHISEDFVVYWIDGGLPEIFSLPGFSPTPVVYNGRYLEFVYLASKLLLWEQLADHREELSERICLKLMAEFSLREGNTDWAVLALAKSMLDQSIGILDISGASILDLETESLSEGYMCMWFFALSHELGHLASDKVTGTLFSKESIDQVLRYAIGNFGYPANLIEAGLSTAREKPRSFVLGLDHLRDEVLSDVFAASLLLRTTVDILHRERKPFRIEQLIFQLTVVANIMSLVERCKLIARGVSVKSPELADQILYSPVAHHVRIIMLHEYLQREAAQYLFNAREPNQQQLNQIRNLFNEIASYVGKRILQVANGLDRAMRFALFPDEREPNVIEKFETQMAHSSMSAIEARLFCDLALSFGATGENLDRLRRSLAS